MILLLQDGSEIELSQKQIENFEFLSTIAQLNKDSEEKILLQCIGANVVRHFFQQSSLCDFQLLPQNGPVQFGFVRDLISLNFFLGGSEKLESILQKKLETFIDFNQSDIICHGLGLAC